MHYYPRLTGLLALAVALSAGCGQRVGPEAPEPATRVSSSDGSGFGPATGDQIPANLLTADQRADLDQRISFGFDQSDLTPAAREILSAKAEILRSVPALMLRIEGHADERGSDEYNLALSTRRAASAMRYLVHNGVDFRQLEPVGYGEEQPLDPGENETAWARNRRAEFRVSVGRLAQQ
jgi:peptidoglycan-associated lipoprotein